MPRRYDSADAKRRILTACVRFFLEKGYTRTTVAEIVKEADVSISTFQNVFRTKDGVLVELVKFMFGSQFDMAGQIAGQKLPPVYVYAVETSIQLALTELNENLRDIYLEAYSHTEASEYIYQHTSSELYRIFGPYLPSYTESDFYELEIGSELTRCPPQSNSRCWILSPSWISAPLPCRSCRSCSKRLPCVFPSRCRIP